MATETHHTTTQPGTDATGRLSDVELAITGMTCASCANRIERKLNKLDGVTATVNYATEKAKVTHPVSVSTDDLLRTVEAAGYAAALPTPPDEVAPAEPERDPLLQRLLVSIRLLEAFGSLDLGQNRPLRAGNAVARRLPVGIGAHHPLHLAEREQEVHIHGTAHGPRLHKLAI